TRMEIPRSKERRRGSGPSPKERSEDSSSREKLDARHPLSKRNREASRHQLEQHRLAPAGAACSESETAYLSGNPGGRLEARPLTPKAHVAQPCQPLGERQTSGATQPRQKYAGGG